tara:strand:- start:57 stop:515 length:459 start_codon:yes stop_codon:yes gene_type:complete
MKKLLENYLTLKNDVATQQFNNLVTVIGGTHTIPPKELMVLSGRKREIVQARNCACYIMRTALELPLEEIAERLGYKSHASVVHAIKMHEMDMKFDKSYSEKYHSIMECLVEDSHNKKPVKIDLSEDTMRMFHLRLLSFETRLDELSKMFNQ